MFREVSERKEAFLDYKNIGSNPSPNLPFSKRVGPWFLSKNGHFVNFCFYAKWIKKKCFLNFLKEMKPFWTIKRCVENNPKFAFFQKMEIFFYLLLLCKMEQEKKFWKVFKRKEVFSDYKNMGLKNLLKLHFSNVVSPWLLSKNGDFSTFFIIYILRNTHQKAMS